MTCSIFCINLVICEPSVTLSQGQLIGKISKNEHGKEYFSYLGIPYAKPPIGDLRFKVIHIYIFNFNYFKLIVNNIFRKFI